MSSLLLTSSLHRVTGSFILCFCLSHPLLRVRDCKYSFFQCEDSVTGTNCLLDLGFFFSAGNFCLLWRAQSPVNTSKSCHQICSFGAKMGALCPDCLHQQKAIHCLLHLKRKQLAVANYLIYCMAPTLQWSVDKLRSVLYQSLYLWASLLEVTGMALLRFQRIYVMHCFES